jgi:hypothetical protein
MNLVLVRHVHNPTVHVVNCLYYRPTYAKPVTEEKARRKKYPACRWCLPDWNKDE